MSSLRLSHDTPYGSVLFFDQPELSTRSGKAPHYGSGSHWCGSSARRCCLSGGRLYITRVRKLVKSPTKAIILHSIQVVERFPNDATPSNETLHGNRTYEHLSSSRAFLGFAIKNTVIQPLLDGPISCEFRKASDCRTWCRGACEYAASSTRSGCGNTSHRLSSNCLGTSAYS